MRSHVTLLAVAILGCGPSRLYWMRAEDVRLPAAPAVRAIDGVPVRLEYGSFRAISETGSDGLLVVGRAGVRGARFTTGAIVLGVGTAFGIIGAVFAQRAFTSGSIDDLPRGMLSLLVAFVGAGSMVAGSALMVSGSVQDPVELPQ